MTIKRFAWFGLIGAMLASLLGCAGSQGGARWRWGQVPPGVSPEIAARADTIADYLFVPHEDEKTAQALSTKGIRAYTITDSLWKLLDETRRKAAQQQPKPLATDSTSLAGSALAVNNPAAAQNAMSSLDLADRRMSITASANLLEARKNLEQALALDPFKPLTKHTLALTYKLFAEKFPRDLSLDRAAEKWTELAVLEPGEYRHHYNLGTVAFAQKKWLKALQNFQHAELLMTNSKEVSDNRVNNPALPEVAGLDSAVLFFAIYSQGEALIKYAIEARLEAKASEADSALHHFTRAKELTTDPQWLTLIEGNLKYINWDERNIWGSALRDSANSLALRGKFNQAAEIYDQLLMRVLKTRHAKDDVKWDYAKIEYVKLRRRVAAVYRLGEVIDSVAKDITDAPLDTTYHAMFEYYGTMCHALAIDTMKVNRKVAYDFFQMATTLSWKGRGRSYLQMANLAKTNVELSLQHAESAEKWENSYSPDEKKLLYSLLSEGYRRKGKDFADKARTYFAKLRAL